MEPAEVLTSAALSIDSAGSVAVAAREPTGRGVAAAPAIDAEGRLQGTTNEGKLPLPPLKLGLGLSAKASVASPRSCACTLSISAARALHATQTGVVRAWLRRPDGRSLAKQGRKLVHAFLAWVGGGTPGEEDGAR